MTSALVSNLGLIGMAMGEYPMSSMIDIGNLNQHIEAVTTAGVGKHTIVVLAKGYDFSWGSLNGLILVPVWYALALLLSKAAIWKLFFEIFTVGLERRIAKGITAVVIIHTMIGIPMIIFHRNPISDTWESIKRPHCLSTQDLFKYNCLPNVITDFMMLVLPIPTIWNLKASKRLKVGVMSMVLMATM
jgi:hypothetical protein